MNTLLAIDDGLTSGNLNAADIVWIIAAVLGLLAAIFYHPSAGGASKFAGSALALAVGLTAFGLFLI